VVDAGFVWPPDMGGAVGPAGVVQVVNGAFADYNSNGTLQAPRITDRTFWLDAGISSSIVTPGVADPRIIYDKGSGRFFASEISVGNGTNANQVLLAVSNDSNPLHGFKAISFDSSPGQFADRPTLGVNGDSVTIGVNDFNPITGVSIFSIPKADLTSGSPSTANMTRFDNLPLTQGWTPQAATGAAINGTTILGVDIVNQSSAIIKSTITGAGGPGAALSGPSNIASIGSGVPSPGRQPAPGVPGIDPGDNQISAGVVQVGNSVFFSRAVAGASGDAIQWGVLNITTDNLVSQGLIQSANTDYLYPAIAANGAGVFVIGFNGSSASQNISGYWVSCTIMAGCGAPSLAFAGLSDDYDITSLTPLNRWGDYNWATVDPMNPNDFWLFQQYPMAGQFEGLSEWGTVITEVSAAVPEPTTFTLLSTFFAGLGLVRLRSRRRSEAS
jgi:hypothetical protein